MQDSVFHSAGNKSGRFVHDTVKAIPLGIIGMRIEMRERLV